MKVYIKGLLKSANKQTKRNSAEKFGVMQIEIEDSGRYRIQDLVCRENMVDQVQDMIGQMIEVPLNVYEKDGRMKVFLNGDPVII